MHSNYICISLVISKHFTIKVWMYNNVDWSWRRGRKHSRSIANNYRRVPSQFPRPGYRFTTSEIIKRPISAANVTTQYKGKCFRGVKALFSRSPQCVIKILWCLAQSYFNIERRGGPHPCIMRVSRIGFICGVCLTTQFGAVDTSIVCYSNAYDELNKFCLFPKVPTQFLRQLADIKQKENSNILIRVHEWISIFSIRSPCSIFQSM